MKKNQRGLFMSIVATLALFATVITVPAANAETYVNASKRLVSFEHQRAVASNGNVLLKANEFANVMLNATVKSSSLSAIASGTHVVVDPNLTLVSGTLNATTPKFYSINITGSGVSGFFNGTTSYDAVATGASSYLNINVYVSVNPTADSTVNFAPIITIGGTTLGASDFQSYNTSASATTNSRLSVPTVAASTVGQSIDTSIRVGTSGFCVDKSQVVQGDVLHGTFAISNGTTTVGTSNFMWSARDIVTYSMTSSGSGDTFTVPAINSAASWVIAFQPMVSIDSPTQGVTYSIGDVKVTKNSDTTNLLTECATTSATIGTPTVSTSTVTVPVSATASPYMGMGFLCNLYASTDSAKNTVIASTISRRTDLSSPMNCVFSNVPAGTYVVAVRDLGMGNTGTEQSFSTTITVASTTVVKTNPTQPTFAASVKVGKTFTVALSATLGSSTKGANSQGVVTVVASTTPTICTVALAKNSAKTKVVGYTVKGIKKGTCVLSLTMTGTTAYNAVSTTKRVTVN